MMLIKLSAEGAVHKKRIYFVKFVLRGRETSLESPVTRSKKIPIENQNICSLGPIPCLHWTFKFKKLLFLNFNMFR